MTLISISGSKEAGEDHYEPTRIHGHTARLWPAVTLDGEFMFGTRSLCC